MDSEFRNFKMSSISFKNDGVPLELKNKRELKKFISGIFKTEGFKFNNILYIFTTDELLLNLNRQFLNHDTLTDILTFNLCGHNTTISSEIYISIERVKENASEFKVPFLNELYRVVIHGILHLCGYSDHTPALKTEMRKREDFYLSYLNFT